MEQSVEGNKQQD